MALTRTCGESLDKLPFVKGIEKADLNAPGLEKFGLLDRWLTHAQNQVGFAQRSLAVASDLGSCRLVIGIAEKDRCAHAFFDLYLCAQFDELSDARGSNRSTALAGQMFFAGKYPHRKSIRFSETRLKLDNPPKRGKSIY